MENALDEEDESVAVDSEPLTSCYDALKQLLEGPAKTQWDAFTASGDMATVVSESGSIHWVRTEHVELLLKAGFGVDQRLLGDAPRGSGVNAVRGKDAVMAFLKGIGMEQYADVFVEEGADSVSMIKLMTDEDLDSMGIKRMHRRLIMSEVESCDADMGTMVKEGVVWAEKTMPGTWWGQCFVLPGADSGADSLFMCLSGFMVDERMHVSQPYPGSEHYNVRTGAGC